MKNFLVIGGSSGIGKSLVDLLISNGHQVYASYNQNHTQSNTSNLHYFHLDVLEDTLDLSFLPDQLHGMVYCPGSINLKPFARIKPELFAKDFELQVLGAIKVLQEISPKLKAAGKASVILFSTVAVQYGFNFHTQVATSKGALEGLARSLAAEWAPVIRVNAVAPSLTHSPLAARLLNSEDKVAANANRHPMKRIGQPEDIAEMTAFLLSDKSSWITGQVFPVDGGMSSIR